MKSVCYMETFLADFDRIIKQLLYMLSEKKKTKENNSLYEIHLNSIIDFDEFN